MSTLDLPMPEVAKLCALCKVTDEEVLSGYVVVSPRGTAHHGEDDGDTCCGRDATGENWWWPL